MYLFFTALKFHILHFVFITHVKVFSVAIFSLTKSSSTLERHLEKADEMQAIYILCDFNQQNLVTTERA